ncbi:HTTM domain-containing protein [Zhouia amylolytica]|uniref:HTTM domain-containing protein n=1 Tax=Zhouia amylolytica TaxID=376730 RepID=UPI0020CC3E8B|nr:HTTM domain-containing protein [Zhouia amylolytica]MCQ0111430.1 HTTM domain-containing protein [Zhouia amylolytica]
MLNRLLFKQIDNVSLVVFRVFFGFLIAAETFGAILTGWVKKALIAPEFTFTVIGFEFLQPLPGYGMYIYFGVMGVLGLLVMIGYKYRLSLGLFTVMWTVVYMMQKASYNNHYYLLILICLLMLILPANRYLSFDAKRNPDIKRISMPAWCKWIIVFQLWIVYTYASLAKLYPDWLDFTVVRNLMSAKDHYYLIGDVLQNHWVHVFITYTGILFDLLVIPLLLWKPTRKLAFFASLVFHLFNSIVFQIGIFPYLSLAFTLFFFEPETVRNIFLKKKTLYEGNEVMVPSYKNTFYTVATIYFLIQIALPLRHWFIKDDVLWTEEGHRLSWRMMLRSKAGYSTFKVVDKSTGETELVYPKNYLTRKQLGIVGTKPDVIWQFAQRLKKQYNAQGKEVAIYVKNRVSVNHRPTKPLIDESVDLAAEPWKQFKHHTWLLPSDLEKQKAVKD